MIGSLTERGLLDRILRDPDALGESVAGTMDPPLPAVDASDVGPRRVRRPDARRCGSARRTRSGTPAAVVTRSDLLEYLAHH